MRRAGRIGPERRDWYLALEQVATAAHNARSPEAVVGTGHLVQALAAVQDAEVVRRLCGEAATWVGVEPISEGGTATVGRVRRALWAVRKGAT